MDMRRGGSCLTVVLLETMFLVFEREPCCIQFWNLNRFFLFFEWTVMLSERLIA